ncbi:MAG: alpha/beta hydrolase [Litoreibacter sp.]|nr:alpha/beta hydrolase [Litoreibacter sp.]
MKQIFSDFSQPDQVTPSELEALFSSPPVSSGISAIRPIMALHSSGAGAGQWHYLRDVLGVNRTYDFPQLGEAEMVARGWTMENYRLQNEAAPLVDTIRRAGGPVHLVGHSFGGSIALHIARTHPQLVASLCLYEPTSFYVLRFGSHADRRLFQDLEMLGVAIQDAVERGVPEFGAQLMTEFWGGLGAWEALTLQRRDALARWAPKAPLDCGALLYEDSSEPMPQDIPLTLIYGTQTHAHTRRIVEILKSNMTQARVVAHEGANHLGPVIFRDQTAELIKQHIVTVEQAE